MIHRNHLPDDRDELLAAIDLGELLCELSGIEARGRQFPCPNPGHEQTGSTPPVNVTLSGETALWSCHGCGKGGTALDALMLWGGYDVAAAFDELRERAGKTFEPAGQQTRAARAGAARVRAHREPLSLPTDEQLAASADRLQRFERLLVRLYELKGWTADALAAYGVGFDGERLTLPIRDADGGLVNVCRYLPGERINGAPKMLSVAGGSRGLFPPPERVSSDGLLWLVEGEPDALSLAAVGLPAVGVPGAQGWRSAYGQRFSSRDVVVCCDCDMPGRKLADRVTRELAGVAASVRLLDLDSTREDGYDVGELIAEAAAYGPAVAAQARGMLESMAAKAPTRTPRPPERRTLATAAELLAAVDEFVTRYVVLPGEHERVAVSLFVLHTWALDGAHATPYLLVLSPEKRSGKTRLIEVLRQLVRAPWQTTSTTEAAMFRKIHRDTPTMLLDEIDAIFGSNTERTEPLRAILNAGNRRGSTVARCVGQSHEVADFSVFCPKVLAGIDTDQRLPETIRDRAVTLRMRRRRDAEPVERLRERFAADQAEPIRGALSAWGASAAVDLFKMDPSLPDALGDRAADAWEPLLAIADMAGDDWPAHARAAAVALSGEGESTAASSGVLLLARLRSIFGVGGVVSTADALAAINSDDELPFGGWSDGKGLDSRGLARQLRRYGITPRSVRIGDQTPKGYRADDFADAWSRYLPSEAPQAQHPPHEADPQRGNLCNDGDVADVADVADLTVWGTDTGAERAA